MFYWIMKYVVAGPIVRLLFRPRIVGAENIPGTGPVIIASNHLSFVDSVFLPLLMKRRVVYLAKKEYFTGKGLKGWITKSFFTGVGMLPIDRAGGKASEASLNTGLRVLAEGKVLGIYPEGTRSPDGRLYRGRTGVARMILESHVPVVPIAMIDTNKVMTEGSNRPKLHRITIRIGEPLNFSRFDGFESDRFILRSITDEIMYEVKRLSSQEYVDVYASTVKSQMQRASAAKAA